MICSTLLSSPSPYLSVPFPSGQTMETLASSVLKTVVVSNRGTGFSTHSEVRSGVADCNSIRYSVTRRFSPLGQKRIALVPMLASHLSTSDLQIMHEDYSEVSSDRLTTVHVRFQLQRECSFGEQFYLVGDNLMLGNWEPQSALPLEWSEGHVWTLDLDIPVGETIRYKFLLKGDSSMDVVWQPGSDRIFKTWKCNNMIVVKEDWDIQTISEEDPICIHDDSSMLLSDSLPTVDSLEEETVKEMEKGRLESKNYNDEDEDEDVESTLNFLRKRLSMNSNEFISSEKDEADLQHEKEEEPPTEACLLIDNASLGDDLVKEYEVSATTKEPDPVDSSVVSQESSQMTFGDEGELKEEVENDLDSSLYTQTTYKREAENDLLPRSGDERNKSYYAFSSESTMLENELQWCLKTMQHVLPFWPGLLDRKQA